MLTNDDKLRVVECRLLFLQQVAGQVLSLEGKKIKGVFDSN